MYIITMHVVICATLKDVRRQTLKKACKTPKNVLGSTIQENIQRGTKNLVRIQHIRYYCVVHEAAKSVKSIYHVKIMKIL